MAPEEGAGAGGAGGGGGGGAATTTPTGTQIDFGNGQVIDMGSDFGLEAGATDGNDAADQGAGTASEGQPEYTPEFLESIEGKTEKELQAMLFSSQQQISLQGNEIGKLRQISVDKQKPTAVKIGKDLSTKRTELQNLNTKLEELDALDNAAEYADIAKKIGLLNGDISKLEGDHRQAEIDEGVAAKFNEEFNTSFLKDQREAYKKSGFNFDDDAWTQISEQATKLTDGKLSKEAMESSLMFNLGFDKYSKIMSTNTETATREKIATAAGKVSTTVGAEKHNSTLTFANLSPEHQAQVIDNMSPAQYAAYQKRKRG